MESRKKPLAELLRHIVVDLKEPVLFQQMLQNEENKYMWKLFEWDLFKFAEILGNTRLPFRIGYNAASRTPQWEIQCSTKTMTLSEFLEDIKSCTDDKIWYYCDYKYMHEWFKDKPEIMNSVNWSRFGFDKTGSDSTLWIGSKGAHTNCHQDSYGCNLVAQIHGRKQWLLFPPNLSNLLQPTRVPYEESTIYSKFNFFCPTVEHQEILSDISEMPRIIILEPGDVLLVPPGWWHYVESLELSMSINIWLPIATDNLARLQEALVQLIVARIGNDSTAFQQTNCTLSYCVKLVEATLEKCKEKNNVEICTKKAKGTKWTAEDLAGEYPEYVKLLQRLEKSELQALLKEKRERFSCSDTALQATTLRKTLKTENISPCEQLSENIVNAFCHPDVINKVAELLLNVHIDT